MTNPLAESILYIEASNVPNKELVLSLLGRHSHIDYVFSPRDTGFLIGTLEETYPFKGIGFGYIRTLLETRGREVHSLALHTACIDSELVRGSRGSFSQDMSYKHCTEELREIDEELKEEFLDEVERDSLLERQDQLTDYIITGVQSFRDPGELARVAVQKAIRRAITKLEDRFPDMAAHLRVSIKTGFTCVYFTDEIIYWNLKNVTY